MEIKKILKFVLAATLVFPMIFFGEGYAATENELLPEKTVKGFRGEAKIMAVQWLRKEKNFIALEFLSGNKGQFWDKGSLTGKLADGRMVSIDVANDFSTHNPGMILDHLKALKFKAEISVYSPEQYKELIAKKVEFHKMLAMEEKALEKEIERKIEQRLANVLEKELPAGEKSVLKKMKKELEPEIRKKVVSEIGDEIRRKFPDASAEKLNFEITVKLNKESRPRIKKRLQEAILAIQLDSETGTPEMRKFTEKVITYYRPHIESEVRAQYAVRRSMRLDRLRKINRGEPVKPLKKKKTFWGKIKKLLGMN